MHCDHCGARFDVAASQRGGLVNCRDCQHLQEVGKSRELLFRTLILFGFVFVMLCSYGMYAAAGPVAGGIVLGLGCLLLVIAIFCS